MKFRRTIIVICIIMLALMMCACSKGDEKSSKNVVESGAEYEYDEQGRVIRERYFGSDGTLLNELEFEYPLTGDQWSVMRINNDVEMHAELDELDRPIKVDAFHDGVFYSQNLWEYDDAGNYTQTFLYADGGGKKERHEFNAQGLTVKKTYMNLDDSILYWEEYEYDDKGREATHTRFNANGKADFKWEYTYPEHLGEGKRECVYTCYSEFGSSSNTWTESYT